MPYIPSTVETHSLITAALAGAFSQLGIDCEQQCMAVVLPARAMPMMKMLRIGHDTERREFMRLLTHFVAPQGFIFCGAFVSHKMNRALRTTDGFTGMVCSFIFAPILKFKASH